MLTYVHIYNSFSVASCISAWARGARSAALWRQQRPRSHDSGGRSNMALLFSDEEVQQAWTELDEPQLDGGWEFFTETMNVKIYRLYNKVNVGQMTRRARAIKTMQQSDLSSALQRITAKTKYILSNILQWLCLIIIISNRVIVN